MCLVFIQFYFTLTHLMKANKSQKLSIPRVVPCGPPGAMAIQLSYALMLSRHSNLLL